MNINEIFNTLKIAWPMRDEIVVCMLSKPGLGKTAAVSQFNKWIRENTQYTESKVVEIIASQILPNEVSGITMPVDSTHSMEIYDHVRLSSLKDGDILFFDELLQGSPQTLSACLTLIQERRLMSGRKLPDVMIVAAANPTLSPKAIPEAIRQRFMFITVDFDSQIWVDWMKETYGITVSPEIVGWMLKQLNRDNGGCWNTVSPRTVTKLILEGRTLRTDEDFESYKLFVSQLFPQTSCADVFIDQARQNYKHIPTEEEMLCGIIKAIDRHYDNTSWSPEVRSDWESWEIIKDEIKQPSDIYEWIKQLNDPDSVMEFLDTIDVEKEAVCIS